MSRSINEIIKESLIDELNANHIKTDDLVKIVEDIKSGFDSVLEELKKEEDLTFELGDKYWVVTSNGKVRNEIWTDSSYNDIALKNNAIFKTEEEAKFEAERLKVLRELEKMGRPFVQGEENWLFYLNKNGGLSFELWCLNRKVYGDYYFDTIDDAEKAVEKVGEDRIKKYLFRVEE